MSDLLPVTQADRDAVQAFHRTMLNRLMSDVKSDRPKLGEDEGDAGTLVQAFARHRLAAAPPVEGLTSGEGIIPPDILAHVAKLGRVQWGQTHAHDAEGHGAHVAESVRKTAEAFEQTGNQHMHGLWLEGTETVLCHTGTSPNAPVTTQALVGMWNWLVEQAASPKATATASVREAVERVKAAARYVPVGDGYFDPYASHVEAVDAAVDRLAATLQDSGTAATIGGERA